MAWKCKITDHQICIVVIYVVIILQMHHVWYTIQAQLFLIFELYLLSKWNACIVVMYFNNIYMAYIRVYIPVCASSSLLIRFYYFAHYYQRTMTKKIVQNEKRKKKNEGFKCFQASFFSRAHHSLFGSAQSENHQFRIQYFPVYQWWHYLYSNISTSQKHTYTLYNIHALIKTEIQKWWRNNEKIAETQRQ